MQEHVEQIFFRQPKNHQFKNALMHKIVSADVSLLGAFLSNATMLIKSAEYWTAHEGQEESWS